MSKFSRDTYTNLTVIPEEELLPAFFYEYGCSCGMDPIEFKGLQKECPALFYLGDSRKNKIPWIKIEDNYQKQAFIDVVSDFSGKVLHSLHDELVEMRFDVKAIRQSLRKIYVRDNEANQDELRELVEDIAYKDQEMLYSVHFQDLAA